MFKSTEILQQERQARSLGSGIAPDSLEGIWILQNTWSKHGKRPTPGTDFLLRSLGARLQLERGHEHWGIINQVNLGSLQLRFQGTAQMKGPRPLLTFSFHSVAINLAGRTLLHRSIPQPSPQRFPFFALIAMDQEGQWLTARGRGGGLALWHKDASLQP